MKQEVWELDEKPMKYHDYHWYADELPARKFYLFLAEIGHRQRHLMTDADAIHMLELCEQCAEGVIDENELGELAQRHRATGEGDLTINLHANALFYWVADRYKVADHGVGEFAVDVFAFEAAVNAGLLQPNATFQEITAAQQHPLFASVRERTELEWGALIRCIYGPNPFRPVTSAPAWRTEAAVGIAAKMYDSRDFGNMPILADALQDAGCEHADILSHCRGDGPHVRGCWVVDLVLGKA